MVYKLVVLLLAFVCSTPVVTLAKEANDLNYPVPQEDGAGINGRAPREDKDLNAEQIKILEKEGCGLNNYDDQPGQFADKSQKDRVIACIKNGKRFTIILWGGPAQCRRRFDFPYLSTTRFLDRFPLSHFSSEGMPQAPFKPTHDALVAWDPSEHGALVFYCTQGEWKKWMMPGGE